MFFSLEVQSPLLLDTGTNDKKHVRGGDMEVQLGAALARAGSARSLAESVANCCVWEPCLWYCNEVSPKRGEKSCKKQCVGKENVSIFKHLMWTQPRIHPGCFLAVTSAFPELL